MRHVILHGHIFKNAGTTFDWSLSRSFGDRFVDHREDKLMRSDVKSTWLILSRTTALCLLFRVIIFATRFHRWSK